MRSTAVRANQKTTCTITFKNKEHEKFYQKYLSKCRYQDVYHKALVYCLGIDRDTRDHVKQIYDFQTGCVKPECLQEGWQTSGSVKIIRMAFNLYCNGTPSIYNFEDSNLEGQLQEYSLYTVEELFCCGYARYFGEAVKIRYPEYCFYVDWELKIRMQGTLKDIRWFKGLMERHGEIKVKDVSKPFKNKGTDQYVRVYAEIEKEEK